MRVGFLIGALNSGGAERQLAQLAVGLVERGHTVEVLCYDGHGVLDRGLEEFGVRVRCGHADHKLAKWRMARMWIREFDPEVIHGFMKRASSLAVLANYCLGPRRVVVSDYSTATYDPKQLVLRIAIWFFRFADAVTTETQVNRSNLVELAPWLKNKTVVIRNSVDVNRFQPGIRRRNGPFRFVCVGTVWRAKNPVNTVKAVCLLRDMVDQPFCVEWIGRYERGLSGVDYDEYGQALELIKRNGLDDLMFFSGESDEIAIKYREADALLHASVQDGIPNVVVEGMASGLPLVVSRVSDLPEIVEKGCNGFLCNAEDPESIAAAMAQMILIGDETRREMGHRSRALAEEWFGLDRFVGEYELLYQEIIGRSG